MDAESPFSSVAGPAPRPGQAEPDFSLVLGGPLYQLLRRAHLSDDHLLLQRRRILAIAAIVFLPLVLLAAVSGHLTGGVQVPFLTDVEVYTRFLVALPLLVLAELVVHQRMRLIAATFHHRNLIPEHARDRLESAVASAYRLRNSVTAEVALLALVYLVGITIVWRQYMLWTWPPGMRHPVPQARRSRSRAPGTGTSACPCSSSCCAAGTSGSSSGPGCSGRFPASSCTGADAPGPCRRPRFSLQYRFAFVPVILAHGVLLAGALANQIFHTGARLTDFRLEILLLVIFLIFLVVGPLAVFAPQLRAPSARDCASTARWRSAMCAAFDSKWLRGKEPDEALLGTGDIQSLADLGNSFEVIKGMRLIPATKEAIFQLAIVALVPIVPLLLTMMPLDELLKKLIGVVF